ncbi:MAG: hypothetical protein IJI14_03845 [Anaerolineaceae bacterium]|nr:hypothetical protein [Anaerolineaceae bacterium]
MNGKIEGGMCFCLTDKTMFDYACSLQQLKNVQHDILPADAAEILNSILTENEIGEVVSESKRKISGMNTKWLNAEGSLWTGCDTWKDAMCVWTDYSAVPCEGIYENMDEIVGEITAKMEYAGLPVPEDICQYIGYASWYDFLN